MKSNHLISGYLYVPKDNASLMQMLTLQSCRIPEFRIPNVCIRGSLCDRVLDASELGANEVINTFNGFDWGLWRTVPQHHIYR